MLTQILWWTGNALISFLLVRSVSRGFFKKYILFYIYLSYVFLESVLRFYVYLAHPGAYQGFYWWYTQFIGVSLGYGVLWEIYMQTLADYPGAARMARIVLGIVFAAVITKVLAKTFSGPLWPPAPSPAHLERNLRGVQAILLIAVVGLLVYYAIPIGRNLRGMILGYGFFIGASVVRLALRSYLGGKFQLWWQYLPQVTYDVTLAVWCVGLWSYAPNPTPQDQTMLGRDYELLAAQTTKLLTQVRAYLVRAVRP